MILLPLFVQNTLLGIVGNKLPTNILFYCSQHKVLWGGTVICCLDVLQQNIRPYIFKFIDVPSSKSVQCKYAKLSIYLSSSGHLKITLESVKHNQWS